MKLSILSRLTLACSFTVGLVSTTQAMSQKPLPPMCTSPTLSNTITADKALKAISSDFIDKQGRKVILRGINMSGDAKMPPFMPINAESMLDPLNTWGINVIRLPFVWEALEPQRCEYNESYLSYYEQIIQWAQDRDIYIIVDFHQDGYSRWSISGCGSGFPKWAITSEVTPQTPKNDESCEGWGTKMIFDLSHHKTWEHFHKDTEGAKTRFLAMQSYVANRVKQYDNVIGYEVINEPWGTDTELKKLFEESGAAIHMQDPNALLFIPSHALVASGIFANNISKPKNLNNIVYAPHYYNPGVFLSNSWGGDLPDSALNKMAHKANWWSVPMLLGEFGITNTAKRRAEYMDTVYNWLNKGFHSSTQWNYTPAWRADIKDGWNAEDFSIVNDSGELTATFKPRPAPIAIAGEPIQFTESEDGLIAVWNHNPSKGKTIFYIPENYEQGKNVTIQGGIQCELSGLKLGCESNKPGIMSIEALNN